MKRLIEAWKLGQKKDRELVEPDVLAAKVLKLREDTGQLWESVKLRHERGRLLDLRPVDQLSTRGVI
jgi:hypothetical protein